MPNLLLTYISVHPQSSTALVITVLHTPSLTIPGLLLSEPLLRFWLHYELLPFYH